MAKKVGTAIFHETGLDIPVPLQKVGKNEEPVYPLRSKVPEGTNTIKILLAHSSKQSLQTF